MYARRCEYLHQYDMTRMPLCHFFVEGHCTKDDCQFLHIRPEDSAADCPWYARGFCKHGPKCRKRHTRKELCGSYMAGFCPKGPRTLPPPRAPMTNLDASTALCSARLSLLRCYCAHNEDFVLGSLARVPLLPLPFLRGLTLRSPARRRISSPSRPPPPPALSPR